jgi:hypothetical protein
MGSVAIELLNGATSRRRRFSIPFGAKFLRAGSLADLDASQSGMTFLRIVIPLYLFV